MRTYKVICRRDRVRANGLAPLCLRVTINRKVKVFTLDKFVDPAGWHDVKCGMRGISSEAVKINKWVRGVMDRAGDIIDKYHDIDLVGFEREWQAGDSPVLFIEYANVNVINKKKLAASTKTQYGHILDKMNVYKPGLRLADINYKFLTEYRHYLEAKLGNGQNTVWKNFKFIKTVTNEALRAGTINDDPFKNFSVAWKETHRQYLTKPEIDKLLAIDLPSKYKYTSIDAYYKNKDLVTVLHYFLFCCFTGLRYSDILLLRHSDIVKDGDLWYIKMISQKNDHYQVIPLNNLAKDILQRVGGNGGKIFKVYTSQATNDALKEIMIHAGINKHISFHCSRHTFAMLSLNMGMPMEVVGALLGHRKLATTQVYAKILDSTLQKEMEKWNRL